MKFDWRNNRDFFAGLLYAGVGALGMWIALDYPFGSALRMGPGYFPTVLGGIMVAFGLYVMALGVRNQEKIKGSWSLRALVILPLALALFGYLMEAAGFIPALAVLIIVSASAGEEFKWLEVIPLTIVLVVLSAAGFIYALGLPYPLIKGLWGY